jgi:hypothetical protein
MLLAAFYPFSFLTIGWTSLSCLESTLYLEGVLAYQRGNISAFRNRRSLAFRSVVMLYVFNLVHLPHEPQEKSSSTKRCWCLACCRALFMLRNIKFPLLLLTYPTGSLGKGSRHANFLFNFIWKSIRRIPCVVV